MRGADDILSYRNEQVGAMEATHIILPRNSNGFNWSLQHLRIEYRLSAGFGRGYEKAYIRENRINENEKYIFSCEYRDFVFRNILTIITGICHLLSTVSPDGLVIRKYMWMLWLMRIVILPGRTQYIMLTESNTVKVMRPRLTELQAQSWQTMCLTVIGDEISRQI